MTELLTWPKFCKYYAKHHSITGVQARQLAGPAWEEYKATSGLIKPVKPKVIMADMKKAKQPKKVVRDDEEDIPQGVDFGSPPSDEQLEKCKSYRRGKAKVQGKGQGVFETLPEDPKKVEKQPKKKRVKKVVYYSDSSDDE